MFIWFTEQNPPHTNHNLFLHLVICQNSHSRVVETPITTYLVDIVAQVTTETKRNVLQISMGKKGVKNVMCAILHFLSFYAGPQIQFAGRLASTFVLGLRSHWNDIEIIDLKISVWIGKALKGLRFQNSRYLPSPLLSLWSLKGGEISSKHVEEE